MTQSFSTLENEELKKRTTIVFDSLALSCRVPISTPNNLLLRPLLCSLPVSKRGFLNTKEEVFWRKKRKGKGHWKATFSIWPDHSVLAALSQCNPSVERSELPSRWFHRNGEAFTIFVMKNPKSKSKAYPSSDQFTKVKKPEISQWHHQCCPSFHHGCRCRKNERFRLKSNWRTNWRDKIRYSWSIFHRRSWRFLDSNWKDEDSRRSQMESTKDLWIQEEKEEGRRKKEEKEKEKEKRRFPMKTQSCTSTQAGASL